MPDKEFTAIRKEIVLKEFDSGKITLEEGGDGIYLRFDCDCLDALLYCRASCCALPGISITAKELLGGLYDYQDADGTAELTRRADGYCVYNSPKDHRCVIYKNRPGTCSSFHCTKGPNMRGWRLGIKRQENMVV